VGSTSAPCVGQRAAVVVDLDNHAATADPAAGTDCRCGTPAEFEATEGHHGYRGPGC
jgi:hypothetical protein